MEFYRGFRIVNQNHLSMFLKNKKRIINYFVLIIGLGVWESCHSKVQHVLVPVDNVRSYKLSENHDTTTIIEERDDYSRTVLNFIKTTVRFLLPTTVDIKNY